MQIKLIVTTVASIGIVGGVCGAGYWYFSSSDLKRELINNSLTPLSKNDTEHQSVWTNLAKKYATEKPTKKLGDLTLSLASNQELNDGDLAKFQDACEALFIKKNNEKDYAESLELAKNWCIKESTKLTESAPQATPTPARADSEGGQDRPSSGLGV